MIRIVLSLLDSLVTSDLSLLLPVAFILFENSNNVVLSGDFPVNSVRNAPFHIIPFETSFAYCDEFCAEIVSGALRHECFIC